MVKADLGLAYLVHPDGKDVGQAREMFQDALNALKDEKLLPVEKAALLINLGTVELAEGSRKKATKLLDEARVLLKKLEDAQPPALVSAVRYNDAVALAKGEGPRRNGPAPVKAFEQYLRETDPYSAWWPVAYDQYTTLCKELKSEARGKEDLQKEYNAAMRMVTTVKLGDKVSITLAEDTDDVLERLGKHKDLSLVGGGLKRIRFEKYPVEILATDRVLAIILKAKDSPTLVLRPQGTTRGPGKNVELRVGMSRKDLLAKLPGARAVVGRNILEPGEEQQYSYYRRLGLAVRYDDDYPNGKIIELVLALLPDPPSTKP